MNVTRRGHKDGYSYLLPRLPPKHPARPPPPGRENLSPTHPSLAAVSLPPLCQPASRPRWPTRHHNVNNTLSEDHARTLQRPPFLRVLRLSARATGKLVRHPSGTLGGSLSIFAVRTEAGRLNRRGRAAYPARESRAGGQVCSSSSSTTIGDTPPQPAPPVLSLHHFAPFLDARN